jgi:hypothetical protein
MRFTKISGKSLLAVVILGAVGLGVVTQALPQSMTALSTFVRMPYLARTEFTEYADDGSTIIDRYFMTSYLHNGGEIVLSSTFPGRPFHTALRRVLDAITAAQYLISEHFDRRDEENAAVADDVLNGCEQTSFPIVAMETILNLATVASQETSRQHRITMWRAAVLGSFSLRVTKEDRQPDGSFVLRVKRQTLKVDRHP